MKSRRRPCSDPARLAFHELLGVVLGALGGAALGGTLFGALAAFVGLLAGAGMGTRLSEVIDARLGQAASEARLRRDERLSGLASARLRLEADRARASRPANEART